MRNVAILRDAIGLDVNLGLDRALRLDGEPKPVFHALKRFGVFDEDTRLGTAPAPVLAYQLDIEVRSAA